jgi:F420-dependent oxidoreductase-like protein
VGVALSYSDDFSAAVPEIVAAERVGAALVVVAEAYSFDAVSRLGYLAAATERMALASGILPLYSRTPALLAMTAAGLDDVSGGRFELGLGSSGPQVIEGFHGVAYDAPLARMRETIEICRTVWRREALDFHSSHYDAPLTSGGTGLGRPLKLVNHPRRDRIPVTVAALTEKSVRQTAAMAEGWVPAFYFPEHAKTAWGDALAAGLAERPAELGDLDITVHLPLCIGEHIDEALAMRRQELALYVGGMGARGANFYNDLAVRYGYPDAAAAVQELYLTGRKSDAESELPDELVRGTSLIGDEEHVRGRVAALLRSGVTSIVVSPVGPSAHARTEQVEALVGMLRPL